MSMRDPEDVAWTYRIAEEQRRVVDVSMQLQSERIVGNLSQLPKVSTFPPQATGDVRYVVVVKMRDSVTGATRESLQEIYSDVPILPSDVKDIARNNALAREGRDTITGARGIDANWSDVRVTIISASQRG